MMTNTFFLECYRPLVMCQTPAPEAEVVWNIPQRKKKQKKNNSTN